MYCRYTDKLNGVFDAEITIRSTNSWTYWQVDGKVNIKELTETAKKVAGFFNASLQFNVDELKFAGTVSPSMVRFGLQIKYTWNGQSQVFKKRVNLDQISPNAVALLLKDKLAPFVKELEKAVHLVGRKISGYGINKTFKQVQNSTKTPLNDGDVIQLLELPGDRKITRGHVRIILGFGGRVSWWKGILLFKKNSDVLKRAVVAGEKKEVPKKVGFFYAHIPVTDLTKYDLVLSKAKTFGVHANMYRITDAARNMKAGKTYIFSWTKD